MAVYDSASGMWFADNGAGPMTREQAMNVDRNSGPSSADFGASMAGAPTAPPPPPPELVQPATSIDNQRAEDYFANNRRAHFAEQNTMARENSAEQRAAFASGALPGVDNGGWWNDYVVPVIGAGVGAGLGTALGGNPLTGALLTSKLERGMKSDRDAANRAYRDSVRQDVAANPSSSVTTGNPDLSTGRAKQAQEESGLDELLPAEEQRIEETAQAREDAIQDDIIPMYEALANEGLDTAQADQARRDQQEGLAMQRRLFEELLGFDPNAYADQFADASLSRLIAAGRSAQGGAAARQAGELAALDQAPAVFAEGQRQASELDLRRQQLAGQSAAEFGRLATGTRGQDENRAATEAEIGFRAADAISQVTQVDMQLSSQEAQALGQLAVQIQQLNQNWAELSQQEVRDILNFEASKLGAQAQLAVARMQRSVSSKDVVGGLLSVAGTVGAAAITAYAT